MNQELERFDPELSGRIAYEHLHRYAICRDLVAGRRVLDVACGVGYGSGILAQSAAQVVGLDIDAGAIRRASKKYVRDNLEFVIADCFDMPFESGSFDVVVANEMIEHIEDHDRFIKEVKRVLEPGGLFLVSTPNKPIYNRYKTPNPFHVSEMDIAEFRSVLERQFGHVHLSGLRMALVSAGFAIEGAKRSANLAAAKTYRGNMAKRARPDVKNDELSLIDPEYVLAICSDQRIEDAPSQSTIFFSKDDDLWLEHEKIMAWASQLHEEDELLRADLRRMRTELEDSKSALDQEKRARTDEAENGSRGNTYYLATASRLLSRLTGTNVDPEPASMIEAIFSLNEQLIEQRLRLDGLADARRRTSELEQELESVRAARDGIADQLRLSRQSVEEAKREREEAEADRHRTAEKLRAVTDLLSDTRRDQELASAERDRLADELDETRSRSEQIGSELQSLSEEYATRRRESEHEVEQARHELAEQKRVQQELKRELESSRNEREELRRKLAETVALRGDGRGSNAGSAEATQSSRGQIATGQIESAQQRRQAQLTDLHAHIRKQLAQASVVLRDIVRPAPTPRRASRLKRLTRVGALKETVIFDRQWIKTQVPDAGALSLRDYLRDPAFHRIEPHPLFAAADYLDRYPDVAEAGISPLQHYVEHGWREGRDPHPYFANDWYLQQNPDVLAADTNPLEHYLRFGADEGRRPNPVFDPAAYRDRYADVRAAGIEPLTHYVMYGRAERRELPVQGFERDWQSLLPRSSHMFLIDHLLSDEVIVTRSEPQRLPAVDLSGSWPPQPLNDYWLPQTLRDYIVDAHGEEAVPLYWFLCSVMDAYSDQPDGFASSDVGRRIVDRIRKKSQKRASVQQGKPAASIIIPAYDNVLDTLLCLESVLELDTRASFEVIVADDGSKDATELIVPTIGGVVRHLRQAENLGFVGNCNSAAQTATGDTIVLLNNDTLVLPGWLDGLLAPFARCERVGLVGSKLINWDGTLQEAGGIFWEDGSAWNFGRGQNARAPEFNYLKEADYCSGASIAVPAVVWRQTDGFDPVYSPAYCEDADLAFRIRAAGFRTLYSPHSELIHHEGRSHGRDVSSGIKAHQVSNQQRLLDRWDGVIARDHYPNADNVLRARDRSRNKAHVLVIDHYVPQWDQDAGSRTIFQYLESFLELGFQVTFWPDNLYFDPVYTPVLQSMGVEVIYGAEFVNGFEDFIKERSDLYDAVLMSRPHVAIKYLRPLKANCSARILYYGHDVHFERMRAQRLIADSVDEDVIEATKSLELSVCEQCDVILYPSEEEAQLMASLVSTNVRSTAIPAYRFDKSEIAEGAKAIESISSSPEQPAKLLFVGGFSHGPNVDGIVWFCREVAPVLRRDGFQFQLNIIGSNPSADVRDLEREDTQVLGYVSDESLREYYRNCSTVIAPLRFGAGVKGKVIEAMARGVPVVTTRVGAQGLASADSYLFIGETPEEFANAIRAAANVDAAKNKAGAALEYVRSHYSAAALMDVFRQVLPLNTTIAQAE